MRIGLLIFSILFLFLLVFHLLFIFHCFCFYFLCCLLVCQKADKGKVALYGQLGHRDRGVSKKKLVGYNTETGQ